MARPARRTEPQDRSRAPFLRHVSTVGSINPRQYPFTIPAFRHGIDLAIERSVTFFVGENGSGKSTLLEAIAFHCGFNLEGGTRDHRYQSHPETPPLAESLRLSWIPKVTRGFFMRAESFFNFATYIDQITDGDYRAYGGKSLHQQSHGESFLSLFQNRFTNGVYILDEPEAALSPKRQLSFLKIIHDLDVAGHTQFLIATHSPMLLTCPGAAILSLDGDQIESIAYQDTEHYRLTRDFLDAPERYFRHLFTDPED